MIALTALGNRAWGEDQGSHWLGLLIMTLGVFLSHPILWAVPFYALALWIWRAPSPKPWVDAAKSEGTWKAAFQRGLYVLPFGIVLAVATLDPTHLVLACVAVFAVPAAYWLGFKFKFALGSAGSMAELLAGAVMGCI